MKYKQLAENLRENKNKIILIVILIIGFLSRLVLIDSYPNALNVDEASSGYEAWSILNYGIDRNGNSWPIFLIAWGSGQNALYSYLMIPFVRILGLNMISLRLPMALLGCISLIVFYLLLKEIKDEKTALIGVAFLAICPWHIMKSRWGLESNSFPELVLIASYFLILSVKRQRIGWLYLGSFLLRSYSIFIYDIMLFLAIFCNTIAICTSKKKAYYNKKCNYFFNNYCNTSFTNDAICNDKYI